MGWKIHLINCATRYIYHFNFKRLELINVFDRTSQNSLNII